jgi:hypothetical protein
MPYNIICNSPTIPSLNLTAVFSDCKRFQRAKHYSAATTPAIPSASNPPTTLFAFAAPVNCDILDVVGVADVMVAFSDIVDVDPTPVEDGMTGTTVEDPEEAAGGALVVGALPDVVLDPAAVALALAVSDARVPVRV